MSVTDPDADLDATLIQGAVMYYDPATNRLVLSFRHPVDKRVIAWAQKYDIKIVLLT